MLTTLCELTCGTRPVNCCFIMFCIMSGFVISCSCIPLASDFLLNTPVSCAIHRHDCVCTRRGCGKQIAKHSSNDNLLMLVCLVWARMTGQPLLRECKVYLCCKKASALLHSGSWQVASALSQYLRPSQSLFLSDLFGISRRAAGTRVGQHLQDIQFPWRT